MVAAKLEKRARIHRHIERRPLPIYVKILFVPRKSAKTVEFADETPIGLSGRNRLIVDDLIVFDNTRTYGRDVDFTLNERSASLAPLTSLLGKTVTISYSEYRAAYQCSINDGTGSRVVMFDTERPYPDDETEFAPLEIDKTIRRFPVIDELGTLSTVHPGPGRRRAKRRISSTN
jgi:hypothetical protein